MTASRIVEDCDFLIDVMDFGPFPSVYSAAESGAPKGHTLSFSTAIGSGPFRGFSTPRHYTGRVRPVIEPMWMFDTPPI